MGREEEVPGTERPTPAETGGLGEGDVPSTSDGDLRSGERGSKSMTSMDFLLAGKSVKVNPYLRAFAASGLPERMRGDDNFSSWTNIKGKVLRKEIAEASAAASRIPRAVAKARGMPAAAADGTGADDPLGDGEGVVLFDLCSGKGFTSIFLAHKYPKARILMFDFNRKMNLKHLPSLAPNVTFHRLNLYDDEVQSLVADAVIEHGDRGSCIVGVHLCGDLSRRAIELWDRCGVDAMVLSPCCLVTELAEMKRPKGTFGYGMARLAKRTGWDSYRLWCLFLWNHIGVMGHDGDDGDDVDRGGGDGDGGEYVTRHARDLNWDDDMISQRNAFICVARGAPCAPCG